MKWCLCKGLAWCHTHREYHVDRWVEITAFSDPTHTFLCQTCSGAKREWPEVCVPDWLLNHGR